MSPFRVKLTVVSGLVLFLGSGCSHKAPGPPPQFLGAWRDQQGRTSLHFLANGTVTIGVNSPRVDYSFSALWRLVDSNHIRFDPPAGLPDIMLPPEFTLSKTSVLGNELTLTRADGNVSKYERLR